MTRIHISDVLIVLAALAILAVLFGCTAKSVDYTGTDGSHVRIESYGLLAGHNIAAGKYVSSPTTRSVEIEGYGQDVKAAELIGAALLEALKKAP